MEIRKVNVERFDAAFKAMLRNADFRMSDECQCLKGSYLNFVYGIEGGSFPGDLEGDHCTWYHFNISFDCYREWYQPLNDDNKATWPQSLDLTDARACIENVKRIVEKHHGLQDWLPLFPSKEHSTGKTLQEFIATLGLTPLARVAQAGE